MASNTPNPSALKSLLGSETAESFLKSYWNQRPLLVRGAIPNYTCSLEETDFVQLATSGLAEARVVRHNGPTSSHPWELIPGPLHQEDIDWAKDAPWTVLINEMDRYEPKLARFLSRFRFLPNWLLDDIMVSYATTGGGVGPHLDEYNVFLFQAAGHRRWQYHEHLTQDRELVPELTLRILANFTPDQDTILAPGDMLYLPPGFAHYGTAVDEPCITYSVGFRAPSGLEVAEHLPAVLAEQGLGMHRYVPEASATEGDVGRVPDALDGHVRAVLEQFAADPKVREALMLRLVQRPRRTESYMPQSPGPNRLRAILAAGGSLKRLAVPEMIYTERDGTTLLHFAHESHQLPPDGLAFAQLITGREDLDQPSLQPFLSTDQYIQLLVRMCRVGVLLPRRAPGSERV